MGLKAVLAKLDEAPEGLRSLYKQADGGRFVLDVDGVDGWALEDVSGLKSALSSEKEGRRTAETGLREAQAAIKAFEGLDPKDTREKLTKLEELLKIDPQAEADRLTRERVEAWTKAEGAKFQQLVKERDERLEKLSSALYKEMIEADAVKEITSAKGRVKPLLPHILSRTRVREVDGAYVREVLDDKGNPRIGANAQPMTIAELVAELKADGDFAGNFEGSGHSGSGSGSGAGGGGGAGAPPAGAKPVDSIRAGLLARQQRRA